MPLLAVALDERLRRHLAEAIRRYRLDLRRDAMPTPSDLADFHELLAAGLRETQQPPEVEGSSAVPDDGLMTRRAAARYLNVSVSTLDRLVKAGEIPSRKIGSRRMFKREELSAL